MDTADKVSVNLLLSDILSFVGDESMREHGFNKGFYVSSIQKAVEDLAYETFFDVQTTDLPLQEENKQNLAIEMPPNCFNIREIYLFNCTCSDASDTTVHSCCTPSSSVIVHWKRLYNNAGKGKSYTAKRVTSGRSSTDPIYGVDGLGNTNDFPTGNLYYANIQNGLIMLSSNSASFSYIRLVYNGTGGAIGDEPIIPRFLRSVIVDYVTERVFRALTAKEPRKYRALWADSYARLSDERNGSWVKAERRIKSLDTFKRDTMRQWTGRMNY